MGRKIMVVTAAYGADQVRQAGGQRAMLPVIAGAGADGVEIRRELFNSEELQALPALGESIELLGLLACYSAPAPVYARRCPQPRPSPLPFRSQHAQRAVAEGIHWDISAAPGRLPPCALCSMRAAWHWWWKTTRPTAASLRRCSASRPPAGKWRPVTLTFDMGNWLWVGDSPEEAATRLAPAVSYIHVKAAVPHKAQFRAVAPDRADARWLALLSQLPADAPRGIEFPLEGADLTAVTRHYVNLLREE